MAQTKIPRFKLLGEVRFLDYRWPLARWRPRLRCREDAQLTYGLLITHLEGTWPGKSIRGYSHRIGDLDIACRRVLLTREVEHREPSPRELWQQLDYETWEASGALVPSSPRDDETFEVNERRRAEAWQTSLRRWREFYYQCWAQNMCGPDARRYAFEIRGPSTC